MSGKGKGKAKGGGKEGGDDEKGGGKVKAANHVKVRHILCEKQSKILEVFSLSFFLSFSFWFVLIMFKAHQKVTEGIPLFFRHYLVLPNSSFFRWGIL